jgi:chromosome segregation ATPase
MGTLTLIIYGVALGQTTDGPSVETYQQVIDKIAQITAEIERLKVMIAQALEREKQIADLKDEIARLQSMLPRSFDEMKLATDLLPQHKELMRRVKSLEEQLAQSGLQLDHLKDQIKTAQEELDRIGLVRPSGLIPTL